MIRSVTVCLTLLLTGLASGQQTHMLETRMVHLRPDGPREWSDFPETPEANEWRTEFDADKNAAPWTLQLSQFDVKAAWNVTLNDRRLGPLVRDENEMVVYFDVPPGTTVAGPNTLVIAQDQRRTAIDDIRVGRIVLHRVERTRVVGESRLSVRVSDADTGKTLPARITVVAENGDLQTTAAESNDHLAVRPGTIYCANGAAEFGVPAGKFTLLAGRGFEYSLDSADVQVGPGESKRVELKIRREVDTTGYVACDTHVHTRTHSGHGDSTVYERMITLAAEGIELPIATDHNVHIDHDPFAREMQVRQHFTPVIGNEVTTPTGHFNIFPVRAGSPIPPFQSTRWSETLDGIYATAGVKIAILNHARDVHRGVRPFGPRRFNEVAGENLDGWAMRFNAMEVVNSAANQNDLLRLFHDWMALLNGGRQVTPVGSSDSHDVARHFVGQGRTYIRCDDRDPGNIDVEMAVASFRQGRVQVSFGLLTELIVNGKYGSGEMAALTGDEVTARIRVLGPHWTSADRAILFGNGRPIREFTIDANERRLGGVIWEQVVTIRRPQHDLHLVAVAVGPGVGGLHWRTPKPYQATSPDWTPQSIGCSGAVWLDGDADGRVTSARDYADRVVQRADSDLSRLMDGLSEYDQAVASQAAHLWQTSGARLLAPSVQEQIGKADAHVQAGFRAYLAAWRETQQARAAGD